MGQQSQDSRTWQASLDGLMTDRRGLLKGGFLATAGLSLSGLLRRQAMAGTAAENKRGNSIILLHMRGGPSQLETWDMKPEAPIEVRGEFKPIATNVPGIQICELLPKTAAMMDKWSIVRSLEHPKEYGDVSHSRGDQVVFTGHPPGPNDADNVCPSVGSVVARQLHQLDPVMLPYVMVPRKIPGTGAAYLGPNFEPFETLADPAAKGQKFVIPNLAAPQDLANDRQTDRRSLLGSLDTIRRDVDRSGRLDAMDAYQQQAWEMVTGPRVRKAFDLESEPQSLRDRYGYPPQYTPRMRGG